MKKKPWSVKELWVSDPDENLFFWKHVIDRRTAQFGNQEFSGLPYYCSVHNWWSDRPCPICKRERR